MAQDPLVGCFGCTRYDGGWGLSRPEATQEKVAVGANEFSKRTTQDVAGVEEHDADGNRWFRPKRLRKHTFYLCQICRYLYGNDPEFRAGVEKRASDMPGRGDLP